MTIYCIYICIKENLKTLTNASAAKKKSDLDLKNKFCGRPDLKACRVYLTARYEGKTTTG
jgi:hypothetical protein